MNSKRIDFREQLKQEVISFRTKANKLNNLDDDLANLEKQ